MSLAIATASREDSPSSTIGTDSSTESGDCPVALATQLRSHWRISVTVISVRGALSSFSGAMTISSEFSDSDISPYSDSSGKALATFPERRLPSR